MTSLEDEEITLPSDTLLILQEFLKEKEAREKLEQQISKAENVFNFEENWQLSQFWYNNKTKLLLFEACKNILQESVETETSKNVALLSCPSLYTIFKENAINFHLYEYDKRFSCLDEFVFYDYNDPNYEDSFKEFKNSFDIIIADPPFLSKECIEKISLYIKFIGKSNAKIILCSGELVSVWAKDFLNLNKCKFIPEHERNLGNEFASYANFDLDSYCTANN